MNKIVKPKNNLKEKVGNGGFDKESLKRAQTAIDENTVDFKPIAERYLKGITQLLEAPAPDFTSLKSELLDNLTQLRAQGSIFHYPSITELTDYVVDLLDSITDLDKKAVEIINAYRSSLNLLLTNNVKSAKDPVCLALCKELHTVCEKYKIKHSR
jgi:translation elongation factor EF-G